MKISSALSIILFLTLIFSAKSQSAKVSYHTYKKHKSGFLTSFEYPIIRSGNEKIDLILNKNIRHDLLCDTSATPLDSAIKNMSSGATAFWFDTDVTYNKNNLISIIMGYEVCAANCQNYSEAFVYSLTTGKRLDLIDILDTTLFYKDVLIPDVKKQYQNNISEVTNLRDESKNLGEVQQDYYNYYIEIYKNLRDKFKMSSFCLYNDRIEIMDECIFNRIDSPMCPEVYFSYKYTDILKYLKLQFN